MHGKIYHIDEVVFDSPPLHGNCRCNILEMESIRSGNATRNASDGVDYWLKHYGKLPDYYISEEDAKKLGWKRGKPPVRYAPDKMITMGVYNNREGHLPQVIGRIWYEADINYYSGRRNMHRVLWSNDGLLFVTYDHYHTFYEII